MRSSSFDEGSAPPKSLLGRAIVHFPNSPILFEDEHQGAEARAGSKARYAYPKGASIAETLEFAEIDNWPNNVTVQNIEGVGSGA